MCRCGHGRRPARGLCGAAGRGRPRGRVVVHAGRPLRAGTQPRARLYRHGAAVRRLAGARAGAAVAAGAAGHRRGLDVAPGARPSAVQPRCLQLPGPGPDPPPRPQPVPHRSGRAGGPGTPPRARCRVPVLAPHHRALRPAVPGAGQPGGRRGGQSPRGRGPAHAAAGARRGRPARRLRPPAGPVDGQRRAARVVAGPAQPAGDARVDRRRAQRSADGGHGGRRDRLCPRWAPAVGRGHLRAGGDRQGAGARRRRVHRGGMGTGGARPARSRPASWPPRRCSRWPFWAR